MAQGGKEMMVGRWRSMLGRLDVQDALDQSYSGLSTSAIRRVDFPLTYHSELIDEDSALFSAKSEENVPTLPKHNTALHMTLPTP